jgi:hypothetical protein
MSKIKIKYDTLFYSCMAVFIITGAVVSILYFTGQPSYADSSFISKTLHVVLYIGMGIVVGAVLGYGCSLAGGIFGMLISAILFWIISVVSFGRMCNKKKIYDLTFKWGEVGFLIGGSAGMIITPVFAVNNLSVLIAGPFLGGLIGGLIAASAARM